MISQVTPSVQAPIRWRKKEGTEPKLQTPAGLRWVVLMKEVGLLEDSKEREGRGASRMAGAPGVHSKVGGCHSPAANTCHLGGGSGCQVF